jgi:hypothetical protein
VVAMLGDSDSQERKAQAAKPQTRMIARNTACVFRFLAYRFQISLSDTLFIGIGTILHLWHTPKRKIQMCQAFEAQLPPGLLFLILTYCEGNCCWAVPAIFVPPSV